MVTMTENEQQNHSLEGDNEGNNKRFRNGKKNCPWIKQRQQKMTLGGKLLVQKLKRTWRNRKIKEHATKVANVLTRSNAFHTLVDWAYNVCDPKGYGHVDSTELYAGMLLVHIKLAKFAGPAACFPPSRSVMDDLFHACDSDNSGGIDKSEFIVIVSVACAQILFRILVNYTTLIFIIPFVSQYIVHEVSKYIASTSILSTTTMTMMSGSSTADENVDDQYNYYTLDDVQHHSLYPMFVLICEKITDLVLFLVVVPLIWSVIDRQANGWVGRFNSHHHDHQMNASTNQHNRNVDDDDDDDDVLVTKDPTRTTTMDNDEGRHTQQELYEGEEERQRYDSGANHKYDLNHAQQQQMSSPPPPPPLCFTAPAPEKSSSRTTTATPYDYSYQSPPKPRRGPLRRRLFGQNRQLHQGTNQGQQKLEHDDDEHRHHRQDKDFPTTVSCSSPSSLSSSLSCSMSSFLTTSWRGNSNSNNNNTDGADLETTAGSTKNNNKTVRTGSTTMAAMTTQIHRPRSNVIQKYLSHQHYHPRRHSDGQQQKWKNIHMRQGQQEQKQQQQERNKNQYGSKNVGLTLLAENKGQDDNIDDDNKMYSQSQICHRRCDVDTDEEASSSSNYDEDDQEAKMFFATTSNPTVVADPSMTSSMTDKIAVATNTSTNGILKKKTPEPTSSVLPIPVPSPISSPSSTSSKISFANDDDAVILNKNRAAVDGNSFHIGGDDDNEEEESLYDSARSINEFCRTLSWRQQLREQQHKHQAPLVGGSIQQKEIDKDISIDKKWNDKDKTKRYDDKPEGGYRNENSSDNQQQQQQPIPIKNLSNSIFARDDDDDQQPRDQHRHHNHHVDFWKTHFVTGTRSAIVTTTSDTTMNGTTYVLDGGYDRKNHLREEMSITQRTNDYNTDSTRGRSMINNNNNNIGISSRRGMVVAREGKWKNSKRNKMKHQEKNNDQGIIMMRHDEGTIPTTVMATTTSTTTKNINPLKSDASTAYHHHDQQQQQHQRKHYYYQSKYHYTGSNYTNINGNRIKRDSSKWKNSRFKRET